MRYWVCTSKRENIGPTILLKRNIQLSCITQCTFSNSWGSPPVLHFLSPSWEVLPEVLVCQQDWAPCIKGSLPAWLRILKIKDLNPVFSVRYVCSPCLWFPSIQFEICFLRMFWEILAKMSTKPLHKGIVYENAWFIPWEKSILADQYLWEGSSLMSTLLSWTNRLEYVTFTTHWRQNACMTLLKITKASC